MREQGFTAVKLGWGPLGADADHDVALAAAACEAGGDGGDDPDRRRPRLRQRTRRRRSASRASSSELGVFWLEEPFEPDEYEAYAELADTVDIRVAAGEQDTTLWGFRELIERGHVDVVQPDVTRCGGITELLRIAEFAHEHGVETVPHAWKSGIIKAASLHVNAVLPDGAVPGVLRRRDPDQHAAHARAPADRRRGLRGRADRPRARRRARPEVLERYRVD